MQLRRLLVIGVCASVTAACGEPTMMGLPYSPYAHEDEPFAEELFVEQSEMAQADDDELIVVPGNMDATFTHVDDLARRSYDAPGDGPTVWFFGGSTTVGIGQRDEHTIPSEVARLAEAAGTPVTVVNFGFPSYVAWQEVGLLQRVLKERDPPDLIVFYHGVNDLGVICRQLALGVEPNGLGNPLTQPQPEKPVTGCVDDPARTGALVAKALDRSMSEARRAAGDVPIREFWQPFAATRIATKNDTPLLERLGVTAEGRRGQNEPHREALRQRNEPTPVDLTDAHDSTDEPIYFDWAHTNELGARLVAEAMWERSLRDEVTRLAAAP